MVLAAEKPITVEEFDRIALLPENRDRLLEFIGGRIVEVVSNGYSSNIGILVGGFLAVFAKQNNLGFVTGADGGYMVSGERYIPDAAFVSFKRQERPSRDGYNQIPPDLAIEVLSPSNSDEEIRLKIVNYLNAGTVVWVLVPDIPRAEIYVPGKHPVILTIEDGLDGGDILPGFKLALSEVFESDDGQEE